MSQIHAGSLEHCKHPLCVDIHASATDNYRKTNENFLFRLCAEVICLQSMPWVGYFLRNRMCLALVSYY